MSVRYISDLTFAKSSIIQKGEYDNCVFLACNFSELDLSDFKFIDCLFQECNLSLSLLNKTVFREVNFKYCKLLGLRFEDCHSFGLSFTLDQCQLTNSSFYPLKIKNTVFKYSQLKEVDFTESDLSNALFESCDLMMATFEHTILEKADFRSSFNYILDPEINKLKGAKFSTLGLSGLLTKYNIEIE